MSLRAGRFGSKTGEHSHDRNRDRGRSKDRRLGERRAQRLLKTRDRERHAGEVELESATRDWR